MKKLIFISFLLFVGSSGFGQNKGSLRSEILLKEGFESKYHIIIVNETNNDSLIIDIKAISTKINEDLDPGHYSIFLLKNDNGYKSITGIQIEENKITFIPKIDCSIENSKKKKRKRRKK